MNTSNNKPTVDADCDGAGAPRAAPVEAAELEATPFQTTSVMPDGTVDIDVEPTPTRPTKRGKHPLLPEPPPEPRIQLIKARDLLAFVAAMSRASTDSDVTKRNQALARGLNSRSLYRALYRLPDNWEPWLDALEEDYPYFGVFFGYLRAMCALAAQDDGVVELELPLFVGPPGTGKSTLVELLVGLLAASYVRVSMSATESGAHLGGSQESWSNSKPRLVFTTLTEGETANPIFLLDELDKTSMDQRMDPLGPLYQLLEPALARNFTDLSVPMLPIDASHILWIATANDARRIPEPIRQRFVQFDIPMPSPQQSLAVARSVMRGLKEQRPRLRRFTLDDSAEDALIGLAPRQMRKQINLGCGQAARAGRTLVTAADFPVDVALGRKVGF